MEPEGSLFIILITYLVIKSLLHLMEFNPEFTYGNTALTVQEAWRREL
jgi:hypothetical protein